jgi:hypothetical protein
MTSEDTARQIWTKVEADINGRAQFLIKMCPSHQLRTNFALFSCSTNSSPIHKLGGSFKYSEI